MRRVVLFVAMLMLLGTRGVPADEPVAAPPVPATIEVQVLGATPHPGNHRLAAGSRLSDALAAAGVKQPAEGTRASAFDFASSLDTADLQRVYLTRTIDGQHTSYSIDMTRSTSHVPSDPVLRAGDKIYVPERRGTSPKVISAV